MPVKLLLADKSITIQKVVEMLFSGREYDVLCVSDGETALSEASRVVPDVVLADVDLPRIDGYSFSARIKQVPALAQTPVILMMSRDDVYNDAKGRESGIIDYIAKPFESQELIGKVKKALAAARFAEPTPPAPQPTAAPAPPKPPQAPTRPAAPAVPPSPKDVSKPKQALPPTDIFDIIQEAPTQAELKRAAAPSPADEEEGVFEVEPVVEVEEPLGGELEQALPIGDKAMEEMRAGLGLTDKKEEQQPEIVTFESLDMATKTFEDFAPSPKTVQPTAEPPRPTTRPAFVPRKEQEVATPSIPMPQLSEEIVRRMVEEAVEKVAKERFEKHPSLQPPTLPEAELRTMAEAAIAKLAKEAVEMLPPPQPPKVSEETVRRGIEEAVARIAREVAREVIEKVAWEVIPELAEQLIKAEIERLKAET
jgi:CheY-like chemotaxis protein